VCGTPVGRALEEIGPLWLEKTEVWPLETRRGGEVAIRADDG
jgi:hypothetical protein